MSYHLELRKLEARAIAERRGKARLPVNPDVDALPEDAVGVALSGGGIRSASFSLGILGALARMGRLKQVDFLSSVSGGGYAGAFLGRLATRDAIRKDLNPCQRLESIVADGNSPQMRWLRSHANYILSAGGSDVTQSLAVLWRNLLAVYFVLGTLAFAIFALLRAAEPLAARVSFPFTSLLSSEAGRALSAWWWTPLAAIALGVLPSGIAFFMAPRPRSRSPFSFFGAAAWLAVLAATVTGAAFTAGSPVPLLGVAGVLLVAAVYLELARLGLPPSIDFGATGQHSTDHAEFLRNRLTRAAATAGSILVVCLVFVVIDTLARGLAQGAFKKAITGWGVLLAPLLAYLKPAATKLAEASKKATDGALSKVLPSAQTVAAMTAVPLVGFLLVVIDAAAHYSFQQSRTQGTYLLAASGIIALLLSRAFDFLNSSSLQSTYAARLTRTFLGASNPARYGAVDADVAADVSVVDPDDDLNFDDYRPHEAGAPFHLIGVCLNETRDAASELMSPDRKGRPMCVSPCGVSIGRGFHARWARRDTAGPLTLREWFDGPAVSRKERDTALRAFPSTHGLFNPLQTADDCAVAVEPLRLSAWMGISGAAFGTGTGRTTGVATSLLKALANVRLGYWWDTSIERDERPGVAYRNLWRKLASLPARLFRMQSLLLAEFVGSFSGPSQRFWYLSDGGHFDVTGIYELIRRRLPLIIAVDGGDDATLWHTDLNDATNAAWADLGATFEILEPAALAAAKVPDWIRGWFDQAQICGLTELGTPKGKHASVARVTYQGSDTVSWVILLKASVNGDEPLQVLSYKRSHPGFPWEPVSDQFYGEAQFESYRVLGEHIAGTVLKP